MRFLYFFVFSLLFLIVFMPSATPLINDTVFFTRLDEDTTSIKDYVGENNFTNYGATYTTSCGKSINGSDSCFYFDGTNDYMKTANSTFSSICPASFTFCAWINNDAGNFYDSFLVERSGVGADKFYLRSRSNTDKVMTVHWSGGGELTTTSSTDIIESVWTHYCYQYDDDLGRWSIFFDQYELNYSTRQTGAIDADITPLWLGQNAYNAEYLKGYVKWLGLWCRALNTSEMVEASNTYPVPPDYVVIPPEENVSYEINTTYLINQSYYLNLEIKEEFQMIWVIALYITFIVVGYWMIQTFNSIAGFILIGLSTGLDFLIIAKLYEDFVRDNTPGTIEGTLYWMFGVVLTGWIVFKCAIPLMIRFNVKAR